MIHQRPQAHTKGRTPIRANFRINSDNIKYVFGSIMCMKVNMGQKIETIIASLMVSGNCLHRSFKVFMLIAMRFPQKTCLNECQTDPVMRSNISCAAISQGYVLTFHNDGYQAFPF